VGTITDDGKTIKRIAVHPHTRGDNT